MDCLLLLLLFLVLCRCSSHMSATAVSSHLPKGCPTCEHVIVHHRRCHSVTSLSALPVAKNTIVGRNFVSVGPVTRRAPAQTERERMLEQQLTVKAAFVPNPSACRRPPPPKTFYARHLRTSAACGTTQQLFVAPRMSWLQIGVRPAQDVRASGRAIEPKCAYTNPRGLFPFQQLVVDTIVGQLEVTGGGMVCAPCGMGKSEMIAAVVAACGVRTVVMEPKSHLAAMMVQRLRQRLPTVTVAQLGGGAKATVATQEADVVVAVNNSAAKAAPAVVRGVGLWIVDEAHHASAEMCAKAIAKCRAARVVGFTATPYRSDGCHVVLPHILGPLVVEVQRPWMPVVVRELRFTSAFPHPPRSRHEFLVALVEHAPWVAMVVTAIQAVARRKRRTKGRVLVLVDRLRFAMELAQRLGAEVTAKQWRRLTKTEAEATAKHGTVPCKPDFGLCAPAAAAAAPSASLFVGTAQTPRERRNAESLHTDVVVSTCAMASEGLDLENIHAVCLFCKPSHPQQHVGRGLRVTTMATVPEMLFTTEPRVPRGATSRSDQRRYFDVHEGWTIEVLEVTDDARSRQQLGASLRVDGKPQQTPTARYARQRSAARTRGESTQPRSLMWVERKER